MICNSLSNVAQLSVKKYFLNIQDENKFNNIIKPYGNDVGMGQLGQQLMIASRKVWRTW
jgi:hypothetical protein